MTREEFFLLNTQKQQVTDALRIVEQIHAKDKRLANYIMDAQLALRLSMGDIVAQMATYKD